MFFEFNVLLLIFSLHHQLGHAHTEICDEQLDYFAHKAIKAGSYDSKG